MTSFVWSDEFQVGIREIDEQHKKLFQMAGNLDEGMRLGKGKEILGKVLKELIGYVQNHFTTEERLMKTHAYPELEEHKAKHQAMTQKVLSLQKDFETGKKTITLDTMTFLQNWLTKHIMGTDFQYGPYLKSKGIQ